MDLIPLSFVAGLLTVLAPCVLPILPVVLGGTVTHVRQRGRAFVIVTSLAVSIVIFTLLLQASTLLIMVHPQVWNTVSGVILFLFGVFTLIPNLWTQVETKLGWTAASSRVLQSSTARQGVWGAVLVGAALGPVFTSCSPTYTLIVAVILPQSFAVGFINLLAYALGIFVVFGLIATGGQQLLSRFKWAVNPHGAFRKLLGVVFIVLGLAIIVGLEKKLEIALLDTGFGDTLIQIETFLEQRL